MIINIYNDKEKQCYNKDNLWHNVYGPDETSCDGYKTYYINNKSHNSYGPAIIHPDGKKEYWLDDKRHSKQKWKELEIIKKHNGGEK